MGTFTGRVRDPVAGRPRDQMIGRSGDVCRTSVIYVFKIQLTNILILLWEFTQDFIVKSSSEKFSEKYSD